MSVDVSKVFYDLFATIPLLGGSDRLVFDMGSKEYLGEIIISRQKNRQNAYPLLFRIMPNGHKIREDQSKGRFDFVLAHNTRLDWFNDQRYDKVFRKVLFPYMELIRQAFEGANGISLIRDAEGFWTDIKEFPNYGFEFTEGNRKEKKTNQVDYWDAISFSVELEIMQGCSYDSIVYDIPVIT
ncbi:hypothetical protein [Spongiimicrobium salis]|uniref:hypothetical protein n=1 Tax=Spongiimicrobium salis TaxID=1667022 RepID=UPI00374DE673